MICEDLHHAFGANLQKSLVQLVMPHLIVLSSFFFGALIIATMTTNRLRETGEIQFATY